VSPFFDRASTFIFRSNLVQLEFQRAWSCLERDVLEADAECCGHQDSTETPRHIIETLVAFVMFVPS
jgi:hypothetical protein